VAMYWRGINIVRRSSARNIIARGGISV